MTKNRNSIRCPMEDPGMMDRKMKEFLESTEDNPTQKKLDEMLGRIDWVEVTGMDGSVITSVSDPERVSQFRETLRIVEDPSTFAHCMCYGDPQIYLYSASQKVAHLSCQHGFAIRWSDGWKWDANLQDGSLLTSWLAQNGAPQLQEKVAESKARAEESIEHAERWSAAITQCLLPFKNELLAPFTQPDDKNLEVLMTFFHGARTSRPLFSWSADVPSALFMERGRPVRSFFLCCSDLDVIVLEQLKHSLLSFSR